MKNVVEPTGIKRLTYVMLDQLETRLVGKVGYVLATPGQEIIGTGHGMALSQQRVAQMRAYKPCSAGYQNPHEIDLR